MSHKSQVAYEDIFNYINKNVFPMTTSASFITDYEVAMRNALKKMYPTATMWACLFHFTQAVKRHASQTPGLVNLIKTDPKAASINYRLQCLPLLLAEFITKEFKDLRANAFKIGNVAKEIFRPFLRYFFDQWIKKVYI